MKKKFKTIERVEIICSPEEVKEVETRMREYSLKSKCPVAAIGIEVAKWQYVYERVAQ